MPANNKGRSLFGKYAQTSGLIDIVPNYIREKDFWNIKSNVKLADHIMDLSRPDSRYSDFRIDRLQLEDLSFKFNRSMLLDTNSFKFKVSHEVMTESVEAIKTLLRHGQLHYRVVVNPAYKTIQSNKLRKSISGRDVGTLIYDELFK